MKTHRPSKKKHHLILFSDTSLILSHNTVGHNRGLPPSTTLHGCISGNHPPKETIRLQYSVSLVVCLSACQLAPFPAVTSWGLLFLFLLLFSFLMHSSGLPVSFLLPALRRLAFLKGVVALGHSLMFSPPNMMLCQHNLQYIFAPLSIFFLCSVFLFILKLGDFCIHIRDIFKLPKHNITVQLLCTSIRTPNITQMSPGFRIHSVFSQLHSRFFLFYTFRYSDPLCPSLSCPFPLSGAADTRSAHGAWSAQTASCRTPP